MLGLGGTAAATGLAAGAKVLGGTVAPVVANAPLAMKTVKHDELYCEEFWAREARKMLEERLPKRDFAALPGPCTDKVNVPTRAHRGVLYSPTCTLTTLDGRSAKFKVDGSLTLISNAEVVRGVPDFHTQGYTSMDCMLSGFIGWSSTSNLVSLLQSTDSFTLIADDNHYICTLLDCRWGTLSHDLHVSGIELNFTCGDREWKKADVTS